MEWVRDGASKRQFEGLVAEASDALFRTGYLMTGDIRDAEDLVQETFLRVARRWDQVRSMDYPAAYARRILINLVLRGTGRRSRQQAELWSPGAGIEAADEGAARAPSCQRYPAGLALLNTVFPPSPAAGPPPGGTVIVIRPSALPSKVGVLLAASIGQSGGERFAGVEPGLVYASPQCTGS